MADAATDLAKGIVSEITPAGSSWLGLLGNLLMPSTTPATSATPPPRGPLPRIVPNERGELVDLNTGKVVGRVGERRSSLADEIKANMELARQGSVMARPEKPQWRKDSPLWDSVLSALDQMLATANPVENIGGPSGAILGPIGRTASKATNLAQKHLAKGLVRGDPELAEMVRRSPKQFQITAPGVGMGGEEARRIAEASGLGEAFGLHRQVSPELSQLIFNPNLLRGKAPTGAIYGSPTVGGAPDLVSTVLHEATHGFGTPLTRQLGPERQQALLQTILPNLPDYLKAPVTSELPNVGRAANEAISYLGEAASRGRRMIERSPMEQTQIELFDALKPVLEQAITTSLGR